MGQSEATEPTIERMEMSATTDEATIVCDYGDRALATWVEDGKRVIAWVGPQPLRQVRVGVELSEDELAALLVAIGPPDGLEGRVRALEDWTEEFCRDPNRGTVVPAFGRDA